ncbi:ferrichrome ABC transporter permease [Floricoccus tropicus]|uniref:Ferrichrome ABC transporter permease n=1 Tax=Floricoccus tropicus TaxID=1859473 RepID=A0A1E8GN15_9LACT|nr:iron ABC transporter permease [Floricoccus tropicus]OFI49632.1 ferrichrome ABC transporter permease [Floricoccus tropicus]
MDKRKSFLSYIFLLLIGLFIISLLTLTKGIENYPLKGILSNEIVMEIRMPRLIAAYCVAILLSGSGLLMQNLTQNPIAEMSTLGISSGSSLAIAISLALSIPNDPIHLIIVGIVGSTIAFGLLFFLTAKNSFDPLRVVLVGTSIGLFCTSLASAISYYKKNSQQYFMWIVGSFSGINKIKMYELLFASVVFIALILLFSNQIKLIGFGSELATSLGVNITFVRFLIMFLVVLASAATVSTVGVISFVGLIGPHIARSLIGNSSFRRTFVLSTLISMVLVTVADFLARNLFKPYEFPVGSILMLLGAPFFLYLVNRAGRLRI